MSPAPRNRLSLFYLVYFSTLGSFLPYWGVYLDSIGFYPWQIGQLMAALVGTKIIAPILWGWLADRSGKAMRIIRVASLIAALAFTLVFLWSDFIKLLAVTLVFSFFWNATLPQFEAVTLCHLGNSAHDYSRIRIWGSIGFVISVVLVGILVDTHTVSILPVLICMFMFGIWFTSLIVPECNRSQDESDPGNIFTTLKQPAVLVFLLVVCLAQAAHGAYYVFYSIYLEDNGYSSTETGLLWALGVVAEIFLFFYIHRFLKIISLRHLLMCSISLGILRWSLIGCCINSSGLVILAQLLHAATFGSTHIAAIHIVHRSFPAAHRGKGQAIYSGVSFGLGGMIGSYTSGELWSILGATGVFYGSALVCLLALFCMSACAGFKDKSIDEPTRETIVEEDS